MGDVCSVVFMRPQVVHKHHATYISHGQKGVVCHRLPNKYTVSMCMYMHMFRYNVHVCVIVCVYVIVCGDEFSNLPTSILHVNLQPTN